MIQLLVKCRDVFNLILDYLPGKDIFSLSFSCRFLYLYLEETWKQRWIKYYPGVLLTNKFKAKISQIEADDLKRIDFVKLEISSQFLPILFESKWGMISNVISDLCILKEKKTYPKILEASFIVAAIYGQVELLKSLCCLMGELKDVKNIFATTLAKTLRYKLHFRSLEYVFKSRFLKEISVILSVIKTGGFENLIHLLSDVYISPISETFLLIKYNRREDYIKHMLFLMPLFSSEKMDLITLEIDSSYSYQVDVLDVILLALEVLPSKDFKKFTKLYYLSRLPLMRLIKRAMDMNRAYLNYLLSQECEIGTEVMEKIIFCKIKSTEIRTR